MKNLLVITTVALMFSMSTVASSKALRASKVLTKLGRAVAMPALGLALAAAPLQPAAAQGKPETALTAVVAEDPAWRQGAMLLRASVPPAEGQEKGQELAFHLAFIGISDTGGSYLVGRERQSGINVGDKLTEASDIALYAWDGMVGEGLTVMAVDSFEDVTGDGYYNVVLLEVEGVNLSENYPPLAVDAGFPYTEERELELLTYRMKYSPALTEEELAEENYMLRWLKCNSVPHAQLAVLDNGFTTCGIIDKELPNSAPLIHAGKLVALQSLDSPARRDEDGKPTVWLATGVSARAAEFSQMLNELATPVNPAGKMATTWAAIKTRQ